MRELEDNTMAKKHGLAKIVLGVGAAAVAGKVAFDKFKQTKERFACLLYTSDAADEL